MGERLDRTQEVGGSSPPSSILETPVLEPNLDSGTGHEGAAGRAGVKQESSTTAESSTARSDVRPANPSVPVLVRCGSLAGGRVGWPEAHPRGTSHGERQVGMYAVVRTYSGQGASEIFEIMGQREEDVKALISGVPGFVNYAAVRSGDGGVTVTACEDKLGPTSPPARCGVRQGERRHDGQPARDHRGQHGPPVQLLRRRHPWRRGSSCHAREERAGSADGG